METIIYNAVEYPTRQLTISNGEEEIIVSTSALNDVLMTPGGNWVDDDAEGIDENIFYYCDPIEFAMSDEDLIAVIEATL